MKLALKIKSKNLTCFLYNTLKEETFAVQKNREIFTFRGNKLSRMTSFEKFRGNKLSRIWLKTAKPRKFLPAKVSSFKVYLKFFSSSLVCKFYYWSVVGANWSAVGGKWSVVSGRWHGRWSVDLHNAPQY